MALAASRRSRRALATPAPTTMPTVMSERVTRIDVNSGTRVRFRTFPKLCCSHHCLSYFAESRLPVHAPRRVVRTLNPPTDQRRKLFVPSPQDLLRLPLSLPRYELRLGPFRDARRLRNCPIAQQDRLVNPQQKVTAFEYYWDHRIFRF